VTDGINVSIGGLTDRACVVNWL